MTGRSRAVTLTLLPVAAFVFGCLDYGPGRGPEAGSLGLTVHAALSLALVFAWFLIDARERGYKASLLLKIAMPALTIVALPYYLLRSRGLAAGALALARAALVFAGTMVAYRLGSWFA
jgi:hypothetical protein